MDVLPEGMTSEQTARFAALLEKRNRHRRDNDGAWVVLAGTMANDTLKRVGTSTFQGTAKRGQAYCTEDPEGLANARLIAAAPELYAALEQAVRALDASNGDSSTADLGRAALTKARGEGT